MNTLFLPEISPGKGGALDIAPGWWGERDRVKRGGGRGDVIPLCKLCNLWCVLAMDFC